MDLQRIGDMEKILKECTEATGGLEKQLDRMEQLKDPAKIQETMDKMKVYEQEFQPINELLATFRKAAESTPNGKIAIEDIDYTKQVKRELGIKVEDDAPAE